MEALQQLVPFVCQGRFEVQGRWVEPFAANWFRHRTLFHAQKVAFWRRSG
jgi:hypothetical protein